jgi:hypothetical protein
VGVAESKDPAQTPLTSAAKMDSERDFNSSISPSNQNGILRLRGSFLAAWLRMTSFGNFNCIVTAQDDSFL